MEKGEYGGLPLRVQAWRGRRLCRYASGGTMSGRVRHPLQRLDLAGVLHGS